MRQAKHGDAGYVLVNALILVAALAAASVYLLGRSEAQVTRGLAGQETVQLGAYLDAFDALAITRLNRGLVPGAADQAADILPPVPLDRGQVAGEITDLQSRFNLNWMANPEDAAARDAFRKLSARVGLAPQKADAIIALLSPRGPEDRAAWAALDPPLDPVGGALLRLDLLWQMPGLSDEERARLEPVVTALPGDAGLNINTASAEVLSSLIPGATPAALQSVIETRRTTPFRSAEDIETRLGTLLSQEAGQGLDPARFVIGSTWFGVRATARLDARQASRRSVIERRGLPEGAGIRWRQTDWE